MIGKTLIFSQRADNMSIADTIADKGSKPKDKTKELIRAAEALDRAMCSCPIQHVSTKVLNKLNDLRKAIAEAKTKSPSVV